MDLGLKKSFFIKWIEQYLFFPTPFQRLVGVLFLPFTVLYCVITAYQRLSKKTIDLGIPVISVGNLLIGGTGKTPVIIALAKEKENIAVVLRGYGRESKGLFVVSQNGKIKENIQTSGDEAMLLAKSLPKATIIVSENRTDGVLKARELGCKVVFLDDGYRHHEIEKFDILLRPKEEPTNIFCLPSGGYRDTKMMYSFANLVLKEDVDFTRTVTLKKSNVIVEKLPEDVVLVTAISKAYRLLEYLPENISTVIFEDHHTFTQEDIDMITTKYPKSAIITTAKDMVKLEQFDLQDIYLMDLEVQIDSKAIQSIENYITPKSADEVY
ncbi:MAG: tetraacyldisaccharide 4'-kinase [Arcobacteraceae bacterium]|nr:tetraacyldisaccharide 4'-kinase [Arcobacteraceae bacterium]